MEPKFNLQLRTILAIGISFAFLFFYNSYFVKKPQANDINRTVQEFANHNVNSNLNNNTPIQANISTPVVQQSALANQTFDVQTSKFDIKFDDLARVVSFKLKEDKYLKDGKPLELIDDKAEAFPLEIRFGDAIRNQESFQKKFVLVSNQNIDNKQKIIFKQKLSDIEVTKIITFKQSGEFALDILLSKPAQYFVTNGIRPIATKGRTGGMHGTMIEMNDDTREIISDGNAKNNVKFENVKFISGFDTYYTSLIFSSTPQNVIIQSSKDEQAIPFIVAKDSISLRGYIGAKNHKILKSIDPDLVNAIGYGFFTFIAKPMFKLLSFIHGYIGNWGWAIIVLTLLIKLVLFPLTYKGMSSLTRMKAIQPKIQEIKTKYKSDPKLATQKTMQLYKKEKVNPLGGCLPMLLQIPVFFALYRVIFGSVELQGAPWILWIHDLSVLDPYYVLPILTGLSMAWQQHVSPNSVTDKTQATIMKFLPVIFTVIFLFFPAGLTLYWFVNNLFSVGQQYIINATIHNKNKGS